MHGCKVKIYSKYGSTITKAYGTEMINRLYGLGVKIMGIHGQLEPESKISTRELKMLG